MNCTHKICDCYIREYYSVWLLPYAHKFSRYKFLAEQEAKRIFTIIFLQITGPSWKGSTCYVLLQICNCCKVANFHGLNFCCIRRCPWNLHITEISTRTVLENFWLFSQRDGALAPNAPPCICHYINAMYIIIIMATMCNWALCLVHSTVCFLLLHH